MKKRVHLSFLRTLRTDISPSFNINSRHQLNIISNTRHEYNRSLLSSMFLVRLKAAFTPRFLFFSFLSLLSLSLCNVHKYFPFFFLFPRAFCSRIFAALLLSPVHEHAARNNRSKDLFLCSTVELDLFSASVASFFLISSRTSLS